MYVLCVHATTYVFITGVAGVVSRLRGLVMVWSWSCVSGVLPLLTSCDRVSGSCGVVVRCGHG